jgi:hypothetical protein
MPESARQRDRSISATEKLRCIERELVYRRRVYPRLVEKGRMSRDAAANEIEIMEAVANDLRAQAEAERML